MTPAHKHPTDLNQRAASIVAAATGEELEPQQESDAVASGRRGGLIGGRNGGLRRAQRLTPERRAEIARQGAEARWASAKES